MGWPWHGNHSVIFERVISRPMVNTCKVCGPTELLISENGTCSWCAIILMRVGRVGNTPGRAWLHKVNEYIARGVDD